MSRNQINKSKTYNSSLIEEFLLLDVAELKKNPEKIQREKDWTKKKDFSTSNNGRKERRD